MTNPYVILNIGLRYSTFHFTCFDKKGGNTYMYVFGFGLLIIAFGVFISLKKINNLPMLAISGVYYLAIISQPLDAPYKLFNLLRESNLEQSILFLFMGAMLVFFYFHALNRYVCFNITIDKVADICINNHDEATVNYSAGFKENITGFVIVDFNDNQNKIEIVPGYNKKGLTLDFSKTKDKKLRKNIISNIKEESNNKTTSGLSSYGLLYVFIGVVYIIREFVLLKHS